MWRLSAERWSNSFTSPVKLENFQEVADIGIRWAIPGGVQRIELSIRAKSQADAYDRYNRHHGHRIPLYDNFCDRPIAAGQVYEVTPDGRMVLYTLAGAWKRHNDRHYTIDDMLDFGIPSADTDHVIKDILDDKVTFMGSDHTLIEGSVVNIGAWHPPEEIGQPAGDAIAELAAIGDSNNNPMDYYTIERPYKGGSLQAPIPVLEARHKTATPNWLVAREDLAGGGLQQSRHIWELKTDVRIGYGRLTGTHTGIGNSAVTLTDSAASFITSGVTIGDVVTNITDGSTGEVSNVGSATQLTVHVLTGGTDNDFDTNDRYDIQLSRPKWVSSLVASGLAATQDLWTAEFRDVRMEMDVDQATAYRAVVLDLFERPVLQQAIVIGSPTIRDSRGARWPLWRVLAHNGGYVRFLDFAPDVVESTSSSTDYRRAFRISAMDYTYKDNKLRLVPDLPDSRLDSILRQADILAGEIISSVPEADTTGRTVSGSRQDRQMGKPQIVRHFRRT